MISFLILILLAFFLGKLSKWLLAFGAWCDSMAAKSEDRIATSTSKTCQNIHAILAEKPRDDLKKLDEEQEYYERVKKEIERITDSDTFN